MQQRVFVVLSESGEGEMKWKNQYTFLEDGKTAEVRMSVCSKAASLSAFSLYWGRCMRKLGQHMNR